MTGRRADVLDIREVIRQPALGESDRVIPESVPLLLEHYHIASANRHRPCRELLKDWRLVWTRNWGEDPAPWQARLSTIAPLRRAWGQSTA